MNEDKWQSFWLIVGTFAVIIVIFFWGLATYNKRTISADECLRLDTNLKTTICLNKLAPSIPPDVFATPEILKSLTIHELAMTSGVYPTVTGIIRNKTGYTITTTIFKVEFYKYGTGKCGDGTAIDTQYIPVKDVLFNSDAKRLSFQVSTKVNTTQDFSWCVTVDEAVIN